MGVRVMNSQLHWIVYSFFFGCRFDWLSRNVVFVERTPQMIMNKLFYLKRNLIVRTTLPSHFSSFQTFCEFFFRMDWAGNAIEFHLEWKKAHLNIQSHFIQCRAEQRIASHCLCIWKTKLFGLKRAHISFEQKTFCFWLKFQKNLL